MTYSVKEIYYTLQGEGAQAGRAAVFLRFAGCNLWSGLERDRATAVCQYCDTDFIGTDGPGGGKFATAEALAHAVAEKWPGALRGAASGASQGEGLPYVVCTGGEPLLQLDAAAIAALHARSFEIGIETNGTQIPPPGIDWICVSPKANADLVLTRGNELKLVYPQDGAAPERYAGLAFGQFFLQPMDNARRDANTAAATQYCLDHPQWRLSLQTHKLIGIR
ncbi:MAG TPA: 7-carboxy-7-deazaguanine synthase [Rhizomicrobium sp.]|jgi:7-carboxy-7-deazaguanine synthase (Cx14CxxC type)|nr:7-carboxy-7-deazaguanine synthase [Rhizomicrobium sp.]